MAAGLDVFVNEPEVPAELLTMENVVLLPHVGSAIGFHPREDGPASSSTTSSRGLNGNRR